jgi:hypothetical protein
MFLYGQTVLRVQQFQYDRKNAASTSPRLLKSQTAKQIEN